MATGQQIYAFRSQFPEFDQVLEPDIAMSLDIATTWVDAAVWSSSDVDQARKLYAAHLLALKQLQLSASQFSGAGLTDIYVQSIGFGERHVTFGQRTFASSAEKSLGPGEQMLLSTLYGMQYIQLRARNIVPVAII